MKGCARRGVLWRARLGVLVASAFTLAGTGYAATSVALVFQHPVDDPAVEQRLAAAFHQQIAASGTLMTVDAGLEKRVQAAWDASAISDRSKQAEAIAAQFPDVPDAFILISIEPSLQGPRWNVRAAAWRLKPVELEGTVFASGAVDDLATAPLGPILGHAVVLLADPMVAKQERERREQEEHKRTVPLTLDECLSQVNHFYWPKQYLLGTILLVTPATSTTTSHLNDRRACYARYKQSVVAWREFELVAEAGSALQGDVAAGGGPYLSAFLAMEDCDPSWQAAIRRTLQAAYSEVYPTMAEDPASVAAAIKDRIRERYAPQPVCEFLADG